MSRRARIRRFVVTAHLWLGLTIGLLWAIQGLTGAILVFHRDIDRATGVVGAPGPIVSLDRVVRAGGGAAAVKRVGLRDEWGDVLLVDTVAGRTLLVEASSARVLAARDSHVTMPGPAGAAWRWLYNLHEALLLGDTGETLIGVSGLLLLATTIGGLWLAWPRRRQWRAAFAVRKWRSAPQRLYGWHRAVGLLAAIGLVGITLTGAWMIFAATLRPLVASVAPVVKPRAVAAATVRTPIAPQAAWQVAHRVFPDAAFVRLTMPTPAKPVYVIRLHQPGELRRWAGVTSVTVDAATGTVHDRYDPLNAPLANRLMDTAFAIHSGEIAGTGGRIGIMLAGLSLPLFFVTGLLAYLGKRRRRRRT